MNQEKISENKIHEVVDAINRQAYATAKSVCSALENGLINASGKTQMYLANFPGLSIKVQITLDGVG
jgi:hypothetical protein